MILSLTQQIVDLRHLQHEALKSATFFGINRVFSVEFRHNVALNPEAVGQDYSQYFRGSAAHYPNPSISSLHSAQEASAA